MNKTPGPKTDKSFLLLFFKKEVLKAFFFEKKKQKTFVHLVPLR